MHLSSSARIAITGAAGLVGQNLVIGLRAHGFDRIVAIDKHAANLSVLRELHPDVEIIHADLAQNGAWRQALMGIDALVVSHAQLGGNDAKAFATNSVESTNRLVAAAIAAEVPYLVHVSSSVLNSAAKNPYTESKKAQEAIVLSSGIPCTVLRPSLMFGWFDRKNLGWLARFMARVPFFPVPGHGRFLRQPLYAGDFCEIIISTLKRETAGIYDVAGLHTIAYVDIVRCMRDVLGLKVPLIRVPFSVFRAALAAYAYLDKNPPFTTFQLDALATDDRFPTVDWPKIFGVPATPFSEALARTLRDPLYSNLALQRD